MIGSEGSSILVGSTIIWVDTVPLAGALVLVVVVPADGYAVL